MEIITQAHANGARKSKACELLNISLRTIERWEKADGKSDKRGICTRKPKANQLSKEERGMIIDIANSKEYCDTPPCKIVPDLADKGCYIASESTFYRVLRAENQLAHRQFSKPSTHHKPKSFTAVKANQVWSWDISYLPSTILGSFYYLYMIVDVYSRKIVGWNIHDRESAEHASALIKQSCIDENVQQGQLVLHSDNGKPMKGMTMLAMLQTLGVIPSFSRPSVSDDNPYSESLFKTVKYHPTYPAKSRFNTIHDAVAWVEEFVQWYNTQHKHSGIKFVTPEQRHTGEDITILAKRNKVYQMAKKQKPERWSRDTRDWSYENVVTLNPDRKFRQTGNEKAQQILEVA